MFDPAQSPEEEPSLQAHPLSMVLLVREWIVTGEAEIRRQLSQVSSEQEVGRLTRKMIMIALINGLVESGGYITLPEPQAATKENKDAAADLRVAGTPLSETLLITDPEDRIFKEYLLLKIKGECPSGPALTENFEREEKILVSQREFLEAADLVQTFSRITAENWSMVLSEVHARFIANMYAFEFLSIGQIVHGIPSAQYSFSVDPSGDLSIKIAGVDISSDFNEVSAIYIGNCGLEILESMDVLSELSDKKIILNTPSYLVASILGEFLQITRLEHISVSCTKVGEDLSPFRPQELLLFVNLNEEGLEGISKLYRDISFAASPQANIIFSFLLDSSKVEDAKGGLMKKLSSFPLLPWLHGENEIVSIDGSPEQRKVVRSLSGKELFDSSSTSSALSALTICMSKAIPGAN